MKLGGETFYKALLDDLTTFVAVLDIQGNIIFVNNTPLIAAGITLNDVEGKEFWNASWWAYSEEAIHRIRLDVEKCKNGESLLHEIQLQLGDGSLIWIEYSMHPILDEDGQVKYLVPEGRNIDNQKKQELALRHSQKMDAIGSLTAGMTHDYNNMLGIISGYTALLGSSLQDNQKLSGYISKIENAVQRSQHLTQKLLSFTKKEAQKVTVCNINTLLKEEQVLLEKTFVSAVKITFELDENIHLTELDCNDFRDAMLNLCINASHAMPNKGELSIVTKNEVINHQDYICLRVSDTGVGMNEATLNNIFDPFFSTKGVKGTGLGMSQVFGFIQRVKALIKVESTLGEGTSVVMHFVKSNSNDAAKDQESDSHGSAKNQQSILVVDDEEDLAELASEILTVDGYKVFTAYAASQALEILKKEPVDLLVTDVIMPDVTGYELASIVHERYPNIKIQMVSGFEGDDFGKDSFTTLLHQNIINKPYNKETLIRHAKNHLH